MFVNSKFTKFLPTGRGGGSITLQAIANPNFTVMAAAAQIPKLIARTRPLPARKTLLFNQTSLLLQSSPVVLFLRPGDFSAQEWRNLRAAIAKVPSAPSTSSAGASDDLEAALKLTVLRPGLLPALLRSSAFPSTLPTSHISTASHLSGPLAVLTAPTLHPPTLTAILKILTTFSLSPSPNAPPIDPKAKKAAEVVERLKLLSSVVEERALDAGETKVVGTLPPLDALRSMIVGLLSSPASRIVGVVGERARTVGRTVEGFKIGLENAVKPESEAKVEA
ncbi:large subunit ribosomal protein L10, partial [Phenoliferia sp. Uapishka_3]